MESSFVQGRSRFPKWKVVSSKGEVIFQNGERFRPWRISFSKMENVFPRFKIVKLTLFDVVSAHIFPFSIPNGQFFTKRKPRFSLKQGFPSQIFL